jgi:antitoxin component YwqK of YwqJK toxin-antitoxin module
VLPASWHPLEAPGTGHQGQVLGGDTLDLGPMRRLPIARVADEHPVLGQGVQVALAAGITHLVLQGESNSFEVSTTTLSRALSLSSPRGTAILEHVRAEILLVAAFAITSSTARADEAPPVLKCPQGAVARQQRAQPSKEIKFLIKSPQSMVEQWCARPGGARHGPYRKWRNASLKAEEGVCRDGVKDGTWVVYDEGGRKIGEQQMRGGKMNGRTTLYYSSGRKMWEGNYRDDREDGESRQWSEEGKLLGQYRLVRGTGTRITWNQNGTKESQCEHRDGKLHGHCTTWRADGSVLKEEEYRNDKRHGRHVVWWDHRRGRKHEEGSYKDGKREGVWREWSLEGKMTQGTFRNDELVTP